MKKYIVEYLENGNSYSMKVFMDYETALRFYNRMRKSEWARIS